MTDVRHKNTRASRDTVQEEPQEENRKRNQKHQNKQNYKKWLLFHIRASPILNEYSNNNHALDDALCRFAFLKGLSAVVLLF